MGTETIDELLEMADDEHHYRLSHSAMLRLALVFIKENYKETKKLNGSVRETIERVAELERYPSLTALFFKHPKQTLCVLLVLYVVMDVIIRLDLMGRVFDYIGIIF